MCPQPNRTNPNKVLRKCSSYQQLKQLIKYTLTVCVHVYKYPVIKTVGVV